MSKNVTQMEGVILLRWLKLSVEQFDPHGSTAKTQAPEGDEVENMNEEKSTLQFEVGKGGEFREGERSRYPKTTDYNGYADLKGLRQQ